MGNKTIRLYIVYDYTLLLEYKIYNLYNSLDFNIDGNVEMDIGIKN